MTSALLFAFSGVAVIAIGLFGLIGRWRIERRVMAFNLVGSGIFLLFGAVAARRAGVDADPVPQAMIITGIVVAFSATALFVALIERLMAETGRATLPEDTPDEDA